MDWTIPLVTICAAFFGGIVGGFFALCAQAIAQRSESIRHTRSLAFRTAMDEWKISLETTEKGKPVQPLEFFIIRNAIFLERFKKIPLDDSKAQEAIESLIHDLWTITEKYAAESVRGKECVEKGQAERGADKGAENEDKNL